MAPRQRLSSWVTGTLWVRTGDGHAPGLHKYLAITVLETVTVIFRRELSTHWEMPQALRPLAAPTEASESIPSANVVAHKHL